MAVTLVNAQSSYLPFKAKKSLHRQENRRNAGGLYSNEYQWKLLLANHPRRKHIPTGSAKDPWNALMVVDRGENSHNYEADESFCCLAFVALSMPLQWTWTTRGRQIFARGTAARPREVSSQQCASCLTSFLPTTTYYYFYMSLRQAGRIVNISLKGIVVNWFGKRSSQTEPSWSIKRRKETSYTIKAI